MEIVIEIIFELVVQILVELGFDSFFRSFKSKKEINPFLAYFGIFFVGSIFGLISVFIFNKPIIQGYGMSKNTSLLITPLAAGLIMHFWGNWLTSKNKQKSWFATFLGGALFSFAIALVRWILI